jgi:hypothetical protein
MSRDPPTGFWQELRRVALMPGLPITVLLALSVILVLASRHLYR